MTYAKVEGGVVARVGKRPDWRNDDGSPVTDERLAQDGWLPVFDERPEHDEVTQRLVRKPVSEWIVGADRVTMAWAVENIPAEAIASKKLRRITRERERRLSLGFDYDFADERGVHHIGTTDADWMGWREVSLWAEAQRALGNSESSFLAIVTDTGPTMVSPLDWAKILDAATAHRQPIWHASFVLQSTMPDDIEADENWS